MIIEKINAVNFRNHKSSSLELHPGINVLVGKNAQGKTNLLEAIFLTCVGRGWRTNKDKEMIHFGADAAHVETVVRRKFGHVAVDIRLSRNAKKTIKINGIPICKMGELMGQVNCVFFSPDELRLVKDAPADRRRFLDIDISQIDKTYFYALLKYNKILLQRNALLKSRTEDIESGLNIWDGQLAKAGAIIIRRRMEFVGKLREGVTKVHRFLTGENETIDISYETIDIGHENITMEHCEPANTTYKAASATHESASMTSEPKGTNKTANTTMELKTAEDLEVMLLEQIQTAREKDMRLRTNTVGPHRDDLRIEIDGKDIRYFASQGQQRTAALSLKLAELEIFREAAGEMPVLLLDDVFSELDEERQSRLVRALSKCQSIVTAVAFQPYTKEIKIFKIEGGTVAK